MSLISEFRATEEAIKELQERLKAMQQDGKLQKEIEFEKNLRDLMAQYGKPLPDIIAILDPASASRTRAAAKAAPAAKRARKVKQYRNPHTNEVIETKGGNHKILKEWKAKWGSDEVEGWATLLG